MTEHARAEYESAWRSKLALPNRRYWLDRLMQTTGTFLAKWQWEVVKRLQDEWRHKTPMEQAMQGWKPIDSAPNNEVVMTKIDDGKGARNEQPLKRIHKMWFLPDASMYVYYKPTHWKPMERANEQENANG